MNFYVILRKPLEEGEETRCPGQLELPPESSLLEVTTEHWLHPPMFTAYKLGLRGPG